MYSGHTIREAAQKQLRRVRVALRHHPNEYLFRLENKLIGVIRHYKPGREYPLLRRHCAMLGLKPKE